ncbi:thiamine-phosphate kinase [Chloroflexota bacterium]
MKVSEIGEFGLIDLFARMAYGARNKQSRAWQQLIAGIGDDTAAWRGDTSIQLATTDLLIQGVHFPDNVISWEGLGWRAMAANLSDIAAMGGLPLYALVSLALPGHTEVDDVTALYRGMIELADQHGVAIVGGDTSSAPLVSITLTILGSAAQNKHILTRSAAKVGDKVAVTGYLGTAAAGLKMIMRQLRFDPATADCLKKAFFNPCPRIAEGQILVEHGVRAAIDISDGLISDLKHICKGSWVGARIEVDRVPVRPEVRDSFGEEALQLALSGGEDYELLFTAEAHVIDGIKKVTSCPVTTIGEIVADKANIIFLVDREGKPFELTRAGWEHFAGR